MCKLIKQQGIDKGAARTMRATAVAAGPGGMSAVRIVRTAATAVGPPAVCRLGELGFGEGVDIQYERRSSDET